MTNTLAPPPIIETILSLAGPVIMSSNRTHAPAATFCLVFCAATMLVGCGQQSDADYKIVQGDPAGEAADGADSAAAKSNTVRLSQNFGVLHPGEQHFGIFEVENPTSSAWTLESITTSCSCTMTRPEAGSIAPRSKLKFHVRYGAGGNTRDETRVVEIRFKEPAAPVVELSVNVSIRAPMTMGPGDLRVYCAPDGKQHAHLNVENYGPKTWDKLTVSSPTKWINPSAHRTEFIPAPVSAAMPREKWEVDVAVSAMGMSPGDYSGELRLSAGSESGRVPVAMVVRGPVALIPSQLFFGRVQVGKAAHGNVIARFANGRAPAGAMAMVSTNLAGQLAITIRDDGTGYKRVNAVLTAARGGQIEGSVRLRFGSPIDKIPELTLPVFAEADDATAKDDHASSTVNDGAPKTSGTTAKPPAAPKVE